MANVKELIVAQQNGTLDFGDYSLDRKTKLADFPFEGDTYKVKTFKEITRLEKNGVVAYESVPGSAVHNYRNTDHQITFEVESVDDLQITLEVEPQKEYKVLIDDTNIGRIKSNLGGKISFGIELNPGETARVKVVRYRPEGVLFRVFLSVDAYRKVLVWQKERQRQYFSAKNAAMRRPNGPASARVAADGTPWWRKRFLPVPGADPPAIPGTRAAGPGPE